MSIRTFSLNSREAYEALCPRSDRPWIEAGSLPRAPRWPRGKAQVEVSADNEAHAREAFEEWQHRLSRT